MNISLETEELKVISEALALFRGAPADLLEKINKELSQAMLADEVVENTVLAPVYSVRKIQMFAYLRFNNQLDDLPQVDPCAEGMPIIDPGSRDGLWQGLGIGEGNEFLVQSDYFEHLRWVHGLVEFSEEVKKVSQLREQRNANR